MDSTSQQPMPSRPTQPVDSANPSGQAWINAFAARLGVRPPTEAEFNQLLEVASIAAHASERVAAPVACWLAAAAGVSPTEAQRLARETSV